MKAADQFRLCFRQVKRYTVGFSDSTDQINEEPERLKEEDKPFHSPPAGLLIDDIDQVQGTGLEYRSNKRERKAQLIADHLRRRTQSPEQAIFRVRSPAGQDDPVYCQTGHR